jgi:hypothetical protein
MLRVGCITSWKEKCAGTLFFIWSFGMQETSYGPSKVLVLCNSHFMYCHQLIVIHTIFYPLRYH